MDKVIAVDFDGTLCENAWPGIGLPNNEVINYLKDQIKEGAKVILWTCRCGALLMNAIRFCEEHGIELSAVNENIPERIKFYGEDSRKISADEYIEDRSCTMFKLPYISSKDSAGSCTDAYWIDTGIESVHSINAPGDIQKIYECSECGYNASWSVYHSEYLLTCPKCNNKMTGVKAI